MNRMKKLWMILGILVLLCLGPVSIRGYAEEKKSTLIPINQWTNQYTNNYAGYKMQIPSELKRDESAFDRRSRFYDGKHTLDIFYDDFHGTSNSFLSYHNYGNRSLFRESHFKLTARYDKEVSGRKAKVMYYYRDKLKKIKGDKNYYASAEIPRSNKEVITVVMKSTEPIERFDILLNTFFFTEKKISHFEKIRLNPSKRDLSLETRTFIQKMFSKDSVMQFGIFEPSAPDNFFYLDNLEQKLDYGFPVILRYQDMDEEIPLEALRSAKQKNKVVELTLQTTKSGKVVEDTTTKILNGEYQGYFERYAKALKELNYPVLFRLNNEMNGDWCQYSAYHYGKDADLYVELYRYVFDIFQKNGANNVLFVWNPNEISFPNFSWNHYMAYYPGNEYVDVVGLTGYNTGNYYRGERWRSFETIYDGLYEDYASRFNHPMMITEFGSASFGGDKPEWMKDMFSKMKKYDRIKLAIWWSGTDWDENRNPARIYRIDENAHTMEAAKEGLKGYKRIWMSKREREK